MVYCAGKPIESVVYCLIKPQNQNTFDFTTAMNVSVNPFGQILQP